MQMSAEKTKKSSVGIFDTVNDLVSHSMKLAGDLIDSGSTASKDISLSSAKHLLKIRQGAMKTGLSLIGKTNKQVDKIIRDRVKEQEWMPEEGKECLDEWADMLDSGLKEFTRVVDSSFEKMLKLVERSGKKKTSGKCKGSAAAPSSCKAESAEAPAKKTTAKKATTKKAPAKKPAAKKKNA